jgi:hypothetical protein
LNSGSRFILKQVTKYRIVVLIVTIYDSILRPLKAVTMLMVLENLKNLIQASSF